MIAQYEFPQPNAGRIVDWLTASQSIQECDHTFEVRKYVKGNGATIYQQQCTQCGYKGITIPKSKLSPEQILNALLLDEVLHESGWRARSAEIEKKRIEMQSRYDADWWTWYNGYLTSHIWKERRRLVMVRANGVCESCLQEPATQVHHLTYDRVGREPLFDLVAICESCHKDIEHVGR